MDAQYCVSAMLFANLLTLFAYLLNRLDVDLSR